MNKKSRLYLTDKETLRRDWEPILVLQNNVSKYRKIRNKVIVSNKM